MVLTQACISGSHVKTALLHEIIQLSSTHGTHVVMVLRVSCVVLKVSQMSKSHGTQTKTSLHDQSLSTQSLEFHESCRISCMLPSSTSSSSIVTKSVQKGPCHCPCGARRICIGPTARHPSCVSHSRTASDFIHKTQNANKPPHFVTLVSTLPTNIREAILPARY